MRPFSLHDILAQAAGDIIGSSMLSCVFINTETPAFIRKLKQGIQFYTKYKRHIIAGRRLVAYHRMICSLRITDSRSVLA